MIPSFDTDDKRGPTYAIWHDLVDWVRGSAASALGQHDFEDYVPYLGDAVGQAAQSTTGTPTLALQTDRFGVLNITDTNGANEALGVIRNVYYDLQNSNVHAVGARVEQNADANDPLLYVGLSDVAAADDVLVAGVVASGSNQDGVGLLWNADETVDIVAVDDGTLTVLKDDIGCDIERTDGSVVFELRIESINSTQSRLTPAINGKVYRSGAVNVLKTLLPENAMRPVVATSVNTTTDPDIDVDWIFSADKG